MDAKVKNVIDKLYKHGEAIEFTPSKEVERLFKYNIVPSKMGGLWDQAFTTMVFAEGDLRQLNAYMLFSQIRLIGNEVYSVEHCKALFKDTIPLCTEFLSTCGLEELWADTKEILAVLDFVDNKADYKELITAFCFYVTNLNNWVHYFFPWYVGELFPQAKAEKVREMAKMLNI